MNCTIDTLSHPLRMVVVMLLLLLSAISLYARDDLDRDSVRADCLTHWTTRQKACQCVQALYLAEQSRTPKGAAGRIELYRHMEARHHLQPKEIAPRIDFANKNVEHPSYSLERISFTVDKWRRDAWKCATRDDAVGTVDLIRLGKHDISNFEISTKKRRQSFSNSGQDTEGSLFPELVINPPRAYSNYAWVFILQMIYQGMSDDVVSSYDLHKANFKLATEENGSSSLVIATWPNCNLWMDLDSGYLPVRWQMVHRGKPTMQIDCTYERQDGTGLVPKTLTLCTLTQNGEVDLASVFELQSFEINSRVCATDDLYDYTPAQGTSVIDTTITPSKYYIYWNNALTPLESRESYRESIKRLKSGN